MKYIRTKWKIVKPKNELSVIRMKSNGCSMREGSTIEELCDEFVIKHKNQKMPFICDNFQKEAILKDRAKAFIYGVEAVYGCIWTSKGLIYVAKMNKTGEFKLI